MKHTFRALALSAALVMLSFSSQAITMFGKSFTFKGDVKEWSEPMSDELSPGDAPDGFKGVPITVRVRVLRKIFRGCRYEIEVTNNDPARHLRYEANHNGKMKRHKIKPGEKEVYEIDTLLDKNCPDIDACGNGQCEFAVRFFDVDIKD